MAFEQEAKQRAEKDELLRLAKTYFEQNDFAKAAETFKRAAAHEVTYSRSYETEYYDHHYGYQKENVTCFILTDSVPDYSCVFQEIQSYLRGELYDQAISAIENYLKHWDIKKEAERDKSLYHMGSDQVSRYVRSIKHYYELWNGGQRVYSIVAELNYLCGVAYSAKNDPKLIKQIEGHFKKSYELCATVLKKGFSREWKTPDFIFELTQRLPFDYGLWEKLITDLMRQRNAQALCQRLAHFLSEQFYLVKSDVRKNILNIYEKLIKPGFPVAELDLALADQECESAVIRTVQTWNKYPQNIYAAVCLYNDAKPGPDKLKRRAVVLELCLNIKDVVHYARLENKVVRGFFLEMMSLQNNKKEECALPVEMNVRISFCLSLLMGKVDSVVGFVSAAISFSARKCAAFFIQAALIKGCPEHFVEQGVNTFMGVGAADDLFAELAEHVRKGPAGRALIALCEKAWEIVSKSGCFDFLKERKNVEIVRSALEGITRATKEEESVTVVVDRFPARLRLFSDQNPRRNVQDNQVAIVTREKDKRVERGESAQPKIRRCNSAGAL